MIAFVAVCAIVLVILAMTTDAADCKGDFITRRRFVTFGTADILVFSFQLEACFIMIEIPILPIPRVVAIPTVRSQCSLMHVLLFVAGHTV